MSLYRWLLRSAWAAGVRAGRRLEAEELHAALLGNVLSGRYDYRTGNDAAREILEQLRREVQQ